MLGAVEFNARFGGVGHYIHVPLEHVLAIVARENGKGMAFTAEQDAAGAGDAAPEPAIDGGDSGNDEQPPEPPTNPERPRQRPSLKLVK